jgi:hypothetical protein
VSRAKKLILHAAFVVAALILAGGALAAKPPAYQGTAGAVQGAVEKGAAPASSTATVGQLPFTGLDLALFTGASVAVVLAGFSFRRLGRKRS